MKKYISIMLILAILLPLTATVPQAVLAGDTGADPQLAAPSIPAPGAAAVPDDGWLIEPMSFPDTRLVLQDLNYTENPIDIPNPDRGFYRGRWQSAVTPFGDTPEVDHRIPVDESSVLYHGRQMPPVEGDDLELTQVYNNSGVWAMPTISFMGFDLCNFSSNAFLSRQAGLDFRAEWRAAGGVVTPEMFEGRTGKSQPLTEFALNYIRGLFQKVRDGNGTAFVKFSYDGNGFNFIERGELTLIYGPEPTYITPNNPTDKCNVPGHEDKDWIEYHLWQLKPIFHEYEDVIMVVKTGMLGPWGEQHTSSKARDPMAYKKMFDAYLDAVPASRSLLTHAGGFLAWYNLTYDTDYSFYDIDQIPPPPEGSPEGRFGWFNDSYAGNYVRINQYDTRPLSGANGEWGDYYSFSEGGRMFTEEWDLDLAYSDYDASEILWWGITEYGFDRYRILDWLDRQDSFCQGEGGIANHVFGNMPGALLEAQKLNTSNMNARHGGYSRWNTFIYNEANVARPVTFPKDNTEYLTSTAAATYGTGYTGVTTTPFFDPVYDGRKGLEFMRDRMGYRLLLREAYTNISIDQDGVLEFEGKIQNVGFGSVVNKKLVSVILQSKDGEHTFMVPTDINTKEWRNADDWNNRADNTAAWRDVSFAIELEEFGAVPPGEYNIYLKINDPKETSANRRCIQFANYDIWNAELGANLIGSTIVADNREPVVIEDGFIKVEVDEYMNMAVYKNGADGWEAVTKPIEKMDASGATAEGVVGAWANALPWSVSTGTGTTNFLNASTKILSAKTGYITTGAPNRLAWSGTNAGTAAGEELLTDHFLLIYSNLQENVKTYFSKGNTGTRLTLVGYEPDLFLQKTLVLETGAVPGTIAVSSYYTYLGVGELAVTKFVENNFKIEASPLDRLILPDERGNLDTKRAGGLWSWQGCDTGEQQERVTPVFDTMGTRAVTAINSNSRPGNGMVRNNWNWTRYAGVAYNYFWGSDVGFGIGSIMPYHVYGLELPVRGSGLAGNHNIGYTWVGWPGQTLVSGEEAYIGTSLIGLVDGDMGDGANMYGRVMDNVDISRFVDNGDFIARDDEHGDWSYVVDGLDYAIPRYEYKYDESPTDYKGVPKDLLVLPTGDELPSWALKPLWETWGYSRSMAPRALFYLIPILARLGYGTVTYDAYWYNQGGAGGDPIYMPKYTNSPIPGTTEECNWALVAPMLEAYFDENPHSKHVEPGDAYDFTGLNTDSQSEAIRVIRAMNEYIHEHGMYAIAWTQNSLVFNNTVASGRIPDEWRVKDINGATVGNQGCTGNPEFINTGTTYISELIYGTGIGEYAFDGYKGDTIYGENPCYATGHGHDGDPYASMRNYGLFYKNLYDKANYLRGATEYVGGPIVDVEKVASMKHCFCGMVMDYYSYSGVNRPIWGDHKGAKQNRQVNRVFRGFYGWDIPMDSDHHEHDFNGNTMLGDFDYSTPLGTGMLLASKTKINLNVYENANLTGSSTMNWPGADNYNQKIGFTGNYSGSIKWGRAVKYYGIYADLKTSQSRMIEGLYKYAVDYPETYALELLDKDPATGKLSEKANSERIYSFYATSFPIDATDPYVRTSTSNSSYYRQVMNSSGTRTFDPWNCVYKEIPNTTNALTGNTVPYRFIYNGPIELRGLKANTTYLLTDVETGEKLTKVSDEDGLIAFETTFTNNIIYHVAEALNGSITGNVYDVEGELLPGATITLYNKAGERVFRDTASDLDGFYSFPVVPAGEYYIVHTFPKEYVQPLAGTAAQPNNDTRYDGYTPVNLDYFDNVYRYVSAPFVVEDYELNVDLTPQVHIVITYSANGGSGAAGSQVVVGGETFTSFASTFFTAPSSNRRFLYWNTMSNGSGTSYQAGREYNVPVIAGEKLTLYAIWSARIASGTVTPPVTTPGDEDTTIIDRETPLEGLNSFAAFINGYPSNTFGGQRTMNREEFVTILFKFKNPGELPEADPEAMSFNDIAPGRWSYDAIEWAFAEGIVEPDDDGNFRPKDAITRVELAVMLVKAEGMTEMAENTFTDLEDHPFMEELLKVVQAGIFQGYPDGTIKPDNPAVRYEVVAALVRYLLDGEPSDEMWEGIVITLTDVPRSHWAYRYVALAMTGYEAPPPETED